VSDLPNATDAELDMDLLYQFFKDVAVDFCTITAAARAIYNLFCFLDKKATPAAKIALSSWLKLRPYQAADLTAAAVSIFDRIYTTSLITISALFRSAAYSTIVLTFWCILLSSNGFQSMLLSHIKAGNFYKEDIIKSIVYWVTTILSDYASLFIVKWALKNAGRRFLGTLAKALFLGVGNIMLIYFIAYVSYGMYLQIGMSPSDLSLKSMKSVLGFVRWGYAEFYLVMMSSLFVHIWLLVFLGGSIGVRAFSKVLYLVPLIQENANEGASHPIEAIGLVGAGIFFLSLSTIILFHYH
jgi:hypothetical protein